MEVFVKVRVVAELGVGSLQFIYGGLQRFWNVLAAEGVKGFFYFGFGHKSIILFYD